MLTSNFANFAMRTLAGEKFHRLNRALPLKIALLWYKSFFLSITSFLSNGITNQGITYIGISNNHNFHFPFHIDKLK